MTTSLVLHDVEKITLKRQGAEGHDWTTLVITHRASGSNAAGEYSSVTTESEIILHHHGLLKLPFKIDRSVS